MVASTLIKLELYTYADVSTAHITARDNTILGELKAGDGVREDEYGYWIYVPAEDDQFEADLERYAQHGLSAAFTDLLRACKANEAKYLRLDRDASDVDGLPKFNW